MDLNGDGHLDLLSGSWPGELFLFRGGPGRTLAAPEMIKDRTGAFINIGGGMKDDGNGGILITGNAEFGQDSKGSFVTYHGKRIDSTPDKQVSVTGTASVAHAVDWDGDGDYDLLVGDIRGSVYLIPNEGTRSGYVFGKEQRLQAGGKPLEVAGDAGPFAADWDRDGDLDLLVGAGNGSVSLFRNTGTARAPRLAAAVQLVPPSQDRPSAEVPRDPQRGIRSKVCVADWDGDGHLDLLVGDYTTQKPNRPAPTAAEKVEQERVRKELEPVQKRYGELASRLFGAQRAKDKTEREKVEREFQEVSRRFMELHGKLPPEYESHGWVWFFRRVPPSPAASRLTPGRASRN